MSMRLSQHIKIISFCIVSVLAISSCDKLPDNGKLDGMWQLVSIEKNGKVEDVKANAKYWSVRLRLFQYSSNRSMDNNLYYSHFSKEGSTLVLRDFCSQAAYEKEGDDNEWLSIEESSVLNDWGLYFTPDVNNTKKVTSTFHIAELTNSSMILTTDSTKLSFRKF